MTREEAIEILKTSTVKDTLSDRWKEAYKMAIQALSQEQISLNDINNALGASFRNGVRSAKVEQEPCDDAISREAVIELIERSVGNKSVTIDGFTFGKSLMLYHVKQLPSVTQKSGKWIDREEYDADRWKCSVCGRTEQYKENYCPNCGAEMESAK